MGSWTSSSPSVARMAQKTSQRWSKSLVVMATMRKVCDHLLPKELLLIHRSFAIGGDEMDIDENADNEVNDSEEDDNAFEELAKQLAKAKKRTFP